MKALPIYSSTVECMCKRWTDELKKYWGSNETIFDPSKYNSTCQW